VHRPCGCCPQRRDRCVLAYHVGIELHTSMMGENGLVSYLPVVLRA
jgi:hypothetical protein